MTRSQHRANDTGREGPTGPDEPPHTTRSNSEIQPEDEDDVERSRRLADVVEATDPAAGDDGS